MNLEKKKALTRRRFIRESGAAAGVALSAPFIARGELKSRREKIRIGLVGAGDRGVGSAGMIDCATADTDIDLVAMGDLFPDHLAAAPEIMRRSMEARGLPFEKIYKVAPDALFTGFDAYKDVIASEADLIILTTPPVFRPIHFKAAVEAGKHVFVEKPVAVDPAGIRDFMETAELARKKGLTVVAGTQMRRARHIQSIVERVGDGAIGAISGGQSVRMGSGLMDWREDEAQRRPEWSDMEWQLRRWLFTVWTSGGMLAEQHVHNLDLVDWLIGARPIKATGIGGRQTRTGEAYPNVWDHITVEYEYPNGARVTHIGSQIDGTSGRNNLRLSGDRGGLYLDFSTGKIEGDDPYVYEGPTPEPAVEEYRDLLRAIRLGEPINEGKQIAESTMTAIMGRIAAYTGRSVSWDWALNGSKLDLTPKVWEFGDLDLAPVAVPGVTKLV